MIEWERESKYQVNVCVCRVCVRMHGGAHRAGPLSCYLVPVVIYAFSLQASHFE